MGGHFFCLSAVWTFINFVFVLSDKSITIDDHNLLQDLGLNILPDIAKINISLEEYTRMMSVYLNSRENSIGHLDAVPKLVTFNLGTNGYKERKGDAASARLKFPIYKSDRETLSESAQLRILASPQGNGPLVVRGQIYQIVGTRRRRLLDERLLYLSKDFAKWIEFDVSSAVQQWLNGYKNLGLEFVCLDCKQSIIPKKAAITSLIYSYEEQLKRKRRSVYQQDRRTDCQANKVKQKCCRHQMMVKFADLKFPEMASILEPKMYEAGFCQGQCPPNYNHATNHSRIQSLVHQMDRKKQKRPDQKPIPKACCAPSKLGPLEILRVNPANENKLMVEKWDNMQVIECACS